MAFHTSSTSNLDFEDLVEELNQFERDARTLKERIASFMDDARQVVDNDPASAAGADGGSEAQDGAGS